jgi:hypothetical protein
MKINGERAKLNLTDAEMRELAGYREDGQLDKPNAVALLEVQQQLRNRRRYLRHRTARRLRAAKRACYAMGCAWVKTKIALRDEKRERRSRKQRGSRPLRRRR